MAVGADPRVGTVLAGYGIEVLLGRGGMGVVYRAHDDALERSVALKLVAPELASDVAFRDRFLVEARLAAAVDHPNVIPVYDAGAIDGQLYLAMRFVEGSDLRELLVEEGRLEPERALEVCGQVAAALDAAHRRGLVHRDVKPSNVLLDVDGHVYLADFGLTRRLSEQAPGFDAGLSLGTPAYVAPEQIESAGGVEATVGPRADQYSLACMLYECLAGEPPFPRSSGSATLFAHLEEEPPSLPRLEGVLARGLAKDPEARFETCTALVEAARQALPQTRRRRRVIAAGALVVLAISATAAVVLATGGDEHRIGDDWTQVPHNEAAFGRTQAIAPTGIAVGESGMVAVGSSGDFGHPDSDMAVWTSPDGMNWTPIDDEGLAEPGWQFPDDVIAIGERFVAVGSEILEVPPPPSSDHPLGDGDAAIWRSEDGTSWERVPHDEELFGGPSYQHIADIAVGGPGLVAVGADDGIRQAAVWTSPDGEHWTRVPPDSRRFGPTNPEDWPNMRRVAVAQDGRMVAVGFEWWAEPEMYMAAVWASSDGLAWTRARHDDEIFGDGSTPEVMVTAVTAGGPGFIAATVETEEGNEIFTQGVLEGPGPAKTRSRIVLSADGLGWTSVPDEQLPDGGRGAHIRHVIRGGPGFVAVGWRRNNPGVADADIDPVVWTSSDGESWTEAADPRGVLTQPGGQLIHKVVTGGSGLVAIGQDGGVKSYNTAIWTSP